MKLDLQSSFELLCTAVPEFIDPRFRENKAKPLVFSHRKRAFWACFRENWVYNFGHRTFTLCMGPESEKLKDELNRDHYNLKKFPRMKKKY